MICYISIVISQPEWCFATLDYHPLMRQSSNLLHIWHKIHSSLYMVPQPPIIWQLIHSNRNSYHPSLSIPLKSLIFLLWSVLKLIFFSPTTEALLSFYPWLTLAVHACIRPESSFLITLSNTVISFSPYVALITTWLCSLCLFIYYVVVVVYHQKVRFMRPGLFCSLLCP